MSATVLKAEFDRTNEGRLKSDVSRLVSEMASVDEDIQEAKTAAAQWAEQRKAAESLREELRERCIELLERHHRTSLKLEEATVSVRELEDKVDLVNIDDVPREFVEEIQVIQRKLRKDDVLHHFNETREVPPGVQILLNVRSLTIRRR